MSPLKFEIRPATSGDTDVQKAEIFDHLYYYTRDNEDELIRAATPLRDQPLGRTL